MRAIDKVTISFGLVSIPTKIYSAHRTTDEISFHLLHAKDGARLRQQFVCSKDGEVVERDEIIKGYEVSRGKYVEMTDEELDALDAIATNTIDVREFVPIASVDPIYVEKSYYLGPDSGGARAYALFARALAAAEVAGVAAYAARGKSYVVLLRPYHDGLLMHQLHYPDEIRAWEEVPIGELPRVKHDELELAGKVIAQLVHDQFHPEAYRDEVKDRIRTALDKKIESGEPIVAPEPGKERRGEVVDLMEALRASLGGGAAKAKRAPHKRAAHKRTAHRRAAHKHA